MKDANLLAHNISAIIERGLPGEKAQVKMLPEGRSLVNLEMMRESAVLILVYPKSGEWHIVLMKRKEYDGPHSGQISLPGGKRDEIDAGLLQTAIRETLEETGVIVSESNIAGKLTPLHIPVSGFVVQPFLAILDQCPVLNADETEVDYLLEVPINVLSKPETIRVKQMELRDRKINVPYYNVMNEVIWGATAMILSEFLDLWKELTSGY